MTNKTKIIVAILIILAIGVAIFGIVSSNKSENSTNKKQDELGNMMEYFNDENDNQNKYQDNNIETENNIVEENVVSEEPQVNNNQVQSNNNQSSVIGKEEQESNIENTEVQDKQKAIELAKKEWGISVDSYDFEARLTSDRIYEVTVRNKTDRNAVAKYTVNVATGVITEE